MGDEYWRYNNDPRQQPPSSVTPKRTRYDYEVPSGREMAGYYSRDDDKASQRVRDTESINASYDRYLRTGQPPYAGPDSARLPGSGIPSHPVDDPRMAGDPRMMSDPFIANDPRHGSDPRIASDPRHGSDPRMANDPRHGSDSRIASVGVMDPTISMKGYGSRRSEAFLPPDANNTIFVEGLPASCMRREVAHIFRPFVGYKEVRLVTKESRQRGRDPLVLCFVDFVSPAHAATAMDALQGYKFDEHDRDSARLRLQFARYPGMRSGSGHGNRGRR